MTVYTKNWQRLFSQYNTLTTCIAARETDTTALLNIIFDINLRIEFCGDVCDQNLAQNSFVSVLANIARADTPAWQTAKHYAESLTQDDAFSRAKHRANIISAIPVGILP